MVRGGLIGCGQVVDELHMPAWRNIPEVRWEAACDQDRDRLRLFAQRHRLAQVYSSLEEILERAGGLDFVSIATPGFSHYGLCCTAIEAGLHVLVEKPLALSLTEALDLQARAQRKKVKVCVGQSFRFCDPVLMAKKAADQGLLGRIEQINVTHHGGSLFHASEPPWRWQEQAHKALLYEYAVHLLDLQVYFAGPVEKLVGVKTAYDPHLDATSRIIALAEHASGATGIADVQAFTSSHFTQLEIYGTANDVQIKFFPHSYRIYSGRVNPLDELACDFLRSWNFILSSLKGKVRRQAIPRRAIPHWRLFRQFVDSLHQESIPVPVPIESVLPTMEFLEQLGMKAYSRDRLWAVQDKG